jgi:predicted RNA-binding protein YlqC (UPF0109 family)
MPGTQELAVSQLLSLIVCSLVDHPGEIQIDPDWRDDGVTLTIRVHPDDVGKLIGRHGQNAKAIRVVMHAAGVKLHRRFMIEIATKALKESAV